MTGVSAVVVKPGWDRTTECCKAGCHNERGVTSRGVASVHCQLHTDLWELRLASLQAAHPATAAVFTPPAPARVHADALAAGVLAEAMLCDRCGEAPRQAADHLCEECRRG